MKVAILALTIGGKKLAKTLADNLPDSTFIENRARIRDKLMTCWHSYDGIICIMAAGIVVRSIAPLLVDKRTDPAVVVIDEKGHFAISLLSGHLGGGNALTRLVAQCTGGHPVITTASDTLGLIALDLWAQSQNLLPNDHKRLTAKSAQLVNSGSLTVFSEFDLDHLPKNLHRTAVREKADIIISIKTGCREDQLILHPKSVVIGTGCNRGTPVAEFNQALTELFAELGIATEAIKYICSIDKKNDEIGLLDFAQTHNVPTLFYTKEQINTYTDLEVSEAALKAVGAIGVAEPTALLGAGTTSLFCRKRKWKNITMAAALAPFSLSEQDQEQSTI